MIRRIPFIKPHRVLAASTLLLPALAQAHPGHGGGSLLTGMIHPLSGLDHLLALLVAGAWAAQRDARRPWLAPMLFVSFMVLGATAARSWLPPGVVEAGIASSVFLLGLMLALALPLADLAGIALICMFALFHGIAHGLESGEDGPRLAFVAGFAASSAALLFSGILVARTLSTPRRQMRLRLAGAAVSCFGLVLLGTV